MQGGQHPHYEFNAVHTYSIVDKAKAVQPAYVCLRIWLKLRCYLMLQKVHFLWTQKVSQIQQKIHTDSLVYADGREDSGNKLPAGNVT